MERLSGEFQFNKPEEVLGEPEYLSREGFNKLQKELEDLKMQRKEIADRLEYAKSLGDLAENADYLKAKEDQEQNEREIMKREDILSRAVLILKEKSADIRLGSTVIIKKEYSVVTETYFLLGPEEADPFKGKISNESPLGSSLIGKKKGDKIEVLTPNGKIMYTIIDVG